MPLGQDVEGGRFFPRVDRSGLGPFGRAVREYNFRARSFSFVNSSLFSLKLRNGGDDAGPGWVYGRGVFLCGIIEEIVAITIARKV